MADVQRTLDEIRGMNLLEIRDLLKGLEDKLGIKAAAPVAVAAVAAPGAGSCSRIRYPPRRRRNSMSFSRVLVTRRFRSLRSSEN